MSWGAPPPPPPSPLLRLLRQVLHSDRVVTADGVGANLVEMIGELIQAIDRNTAEVRRFNDRAEGRE
jgi:hypothetical protein